MAKLTILYGEPEDRDAFEDYYANAHLPFAQRMPNVEDFELTRVQSAIGRDEPSYYRIAEMWWNDVDALHSALGSEEGREVLADMDNFATGGATLLISEEAMPS